MTDDPTLFTGSRFRVVRHAWVADDGREHAREIIRHPGAVTIVPLLDDGRVCLIENYRPAVSETLLELPAGTLEPGEDPLQTARRELAEETGYRAGRIEPLAEFFTSPGILDERMHLYLAADLVPGGQSLDAGEQITPRPTSLDDALAMARDGRIRDAKTLVGLLYYAMFVRRRE